MRWLPPIRLAAYIVCGLLILPAPLSAWQGQTLGSRTVATAREPRPQGESFHVEKASPALERLLMTWYTKTKDIEKLQGKHIRYIYERTFSTGSVAHGKFYYEAPGKGRIDIKPKPAQDMDPAQEGVQIKDSGVLYTYQKCPSQSWICDGKTIICVDHDARTYTTKTLPPAKQGTNMMDRPLPFLFGMPPEKAKQRYKMKIVQNPNLTTKDRVCLIVEPRLPKDASNWTEARVILWRETCLPYAVKLIAQNGGSSTVYVFSDYEVNDFDLFQFVGATSPFRPPLLYSEVQTAAPAPIQPLQRNEKPIQGVPSVIGLGYNKAMNVMGQRGYREVTIVPTAHPCEDPKMIHRVKSQSPKPGAQVDGTQPIQLTIYATREDIISFKKQPTRTATPQ